MLITNPLRKDAVSTLLSTMAAYYQNNDPRMCSIFENDLADPLSEISFIVRFVCGEDATLTKDKALAAFIDLARTPDEIVYELFTEPCEKIMVLLCTSIDTVDSDGYVTANPDLGLEYVMRFNTKTLQWETTHPTGDFFIALAEITIED